MTAEQVLDCPNRSHWFTIRELDGPNPFTCPTCFHRTLVTPGKELLEPPESM